MSAAIVARAKGQKPAKEPVAGGGTEAEVCVVRLGHSRFGLPIHSILEIVRSTCPLPVPLAPEYVGGLVHYRGDVLTTVSLRRVLGLGASDAPQAILVLEGAGGCFGLQVDALQEVLQPTAADYEPNPATLDSRRRRFFAGTYKLRDGLLVMLDPGQLDPLRLRPAQGMVESLSRTTSRSTGKDSDKRGER